MIQTVLIGGNTMLSTLFGVTAFLLYLLYDVNSFRWKWQFPRSFFLLGTILLAAATAMDLIDALQLGVFSGLIDWILLFFAFLCLLALIYCLFFALPFEETYATQANGRPVCDQGAYALCRHPGIVCFLFLYLFLGIAALPGRLLWNGLLFSCLNIAYGAFQDRFTFPKTFCNYERYRQTVPFLIPTRASLRKAQHTFVHVHAKEDNP